MMRDEAANLGGLRFNLLDNALPVISAHQLGSWRVRQ
jgi:hypothetical protein